MGTTKKFKDGVYAFESPTSYAMKKVKDGHVTLNGGEKEDVNSFIKRNGYTKVRFKFELE